MISSSFRIRVLLRVLLLVVFIGLLAASLYKTNWIATPLMLSINIIIAITELIYFVEKTNRDFSDFLLSIKSADFTKYSETDCRGNSFTQFRAASNIIIDSFQHARIDKEAHYIFLKTVVEQLSTAIIAFRADGTITLVNETAKKLLNIALLNNINQLKHINPDLLRYLTTGRDEILEITNQGHQLKMLAKSTIFTINGVGNTLVVIQNITPEIARTETEAWEQLLHVLTHEIMNSITPISSLSATIKSKVDEMMHDGEKGRETIEDMSYGLQVIENRSTGLINFVQQYKSLITLPAPYFEPVNISQLFERIQILTRHRLDGQNLTLNIHAKKDLVKDIDISLIEQVLINLVNNACDALGETENGCIEITAEEQGNALIIKISDNGPGIQKELLSKIFIPFFTTKKQGTGIGLSLARQIMLLHNGNINVQSTKDKDTIFTLIFP